MRTIRREYKTLNSFVKVVGKNIIPLNEVLDGVSVCKFKGFTVAVRYILSLKEDGLKEVAELLAKCWCKNYHKRVVEKVLNHEGDNSYLRHFQLEKLSDGYFIGNSLNGEAYDYCKRMWLKS